MIKHFIYESGMDELKTLSYFLGLATLNISHNKLLNGHWSIDLLEYNKK